MLIMYSLLVLLMAAAVIVINFILRPQINSSEFAAKAACERGGVAGGELLIGGWRALLY